MKALTLDHSEITRAALLAKADSLPGAWGGIRIAALLLLLAGWKSTAIAELFGVSRWAVCQWIGGANEHGLRSVEPQPAPGRKSRLSTAVQQQLDLALQASPEQCGLNRTRWDGVLVVEYLRRFHQVELKVRQAQRYVRRLGFTAQSHGGGWVGRGKGGGGEYCTHPNMAGLAELCGVSMDIVNE